jgi:hypothetical protein
MEQTIIVGGGVVMVMVVALVCSRLLRHPAHGAHS